MLSHHYTRERDVCCLFVYFFVCQRSWGGKGKRCHRTWKRLPSICLRTVKTCPILRDYCSSQIYNIRRFREAGTVENRSRSGRPLPPMDDRDYRQLEKIVKTERRAPLVEITAKFNEERNVSVSKQTIRRRLRVDNSVQME